MTNESTRATAAPDSKQEWAKVDPATAFHLIERHAENWNDAGRMMEAWRKANTPEAAREPAPVARELDVDAELIAAAEAVVARWDSPKWKDKAPTADYIARLRRAIAARQATAESAPASAAPDEQPTWISVVDGLPDLDDPVWLFEDGRAWIGGRSDGGDGWLWCNCNGSEYLNNGVWTACDFDMDDDYQPSHWMPLPPPLLTVRR